MRFGLRVHPLSRDASQEAWAHAQTLFDGLELAVVAKALEAMRASESTGQQRMRRL